MEHLEERWLSVSEAARVAGVDLNTIRRWVDRGVVRGRRGPGGHRRVEASSLLESHQDVQRGRTSGVDRSTPVQDLLPTWAEASIEWYGWRPPGHLSDDRLAELQAIIRDLIRALEGVDEEIAAELRTRDDANSPAGDRWFLA